MTIEQLVEEAMKLPPEERERLGMKLLSSVDPGLAFEDEWAEETQRRLGQLENGAVEAIPGDEVLREARERLK